MLGVNTVEIPNRSLFRQPEVCEIAQVQPYVLRSWEAEFPDLGVSKTVGGPRVYRRADVERVLRLKHLLFVEGLTLAGARRKLQDEKPPVEVDSPALEELLGSDARERILEVKRGLREIATMLGKAPGHEGTAAVARNFSSASGASGASRASAAKATRKSTAAQPLLDLAAAPARGKKAPAKKKR
jgi:DNA-binding transcriptional MerR regulator